jgi:hypothetical protein
MAKFFITISALLLLVSCVDKPQRFKGEYPAEFGNNDTKIHVTFETRTPFNGKTVFDLGWVKFSDLISRDEESGLDENEKEIGRTFVIRTVARYPGILVDPEPDADYYRIYIPLGSRRVVLTEQESKGTYLFSSYPLGPMETPASFFVNGNQGCEDQLTWDMLGKISRNNMLLQVDFHWKYKTPNLTSEQEASLCSNDLELALSEEDFNPAEMEDVKVSNFYQLWYLIIRSHIPNVEPLEMYKDLKALEISVQVAAGRQFKPKWY